MKKINTSIPNSDKMVVDRKIHKKTIVDRDGKEATITLTKGVTLSIAKYEFVRLDASVTRTVIDDDDAIKHEFANLSELEDEVLADEVDKVKN